MDDTYIKDKWVYSYRVVDKFGNLIDYYLSLNSTESAAKAFLNKVSHKIAYQTHMPQIEVKVTMLPWFDECSALVNLFLYAFAYRYIGY